MRGDPLSPGEEKTAELLADGCKTEQIAARLGVSQRTVRTFIYRAREKLGADSMLRLAVLYDRLKRQK